MTLFHNSKKEYKNGQVIDIQNEADYSKNANADQREVISCFQKYINEQKLAYPKRDKSLFAFETVSAAGMYDQEGFVYEVEMEEIYKGPFVLVNTALQARNNTVKQQSILQEYFTPNRQIDGGEDWRVYEYIGTKMKILKRIDNPIRVTMDYTIDQEKSERLFGRNGKHGIIA